MDSALYYLVGLCLWYLNLPFGLELTLGHFGSVNNYNVHQISKFSKVTVRSR